MTVFVALDGQSAHAQTPEETTTKPAINVVVRPGDSLTKIATAHATTYVRLYDANAQIVHPDVIHPGENLRVPAADEALPTRPLPAAPQPVAAAPAQSTKAAKQQPRAQRQAAAPAPTGSTNAGVWDRLAQCESGGNWSINTGNGYSGGLQFSQSSWRGVGGSGLASQASKEEQIARAQMLQSRQGWGAWPACTAKLGIR
ncbi:MAG: transglycosylase family protein [Candidatus Saccharimonadales bacterium]